jgi:hypothetical protein
VIRLHRGELTRVMCAEPGVDSRVAGPLDVVDQSYEPRASWRDVCVARESPVLTTRSGLRVVVLDQAVGSWDALERLGVGVQFSLALLQAKDGHLLLDVGPAAVEYMQVTVDGDQFSGRLDLSLLGEMRALEAGES